MKIRAVKGIRNAHYLENGAVDCEVLFEGETEFALYTAIYRMIWPRQASMWRTAKREMGRNRPISLSRLNLLTAERMPKGGKLRHGATVRKTSVSSRLMAVVLIKNAQSRLAPVVATAQAGLLPDRFNSMSDNNNVVLAQGETYCAEQCHDGGHGVEGFKIHERQREMKEQLNNLDDLRSIREMVIRDN